jgi:thiol-disulfide isomerase/thioredoxin
MKLRHVLTLLLVLATAFALVGCRDDAAVEDAANTAAAPDARPAPDFTLTALDGSTLSLSALRGDVVLVDFWATWCGPCKYAMPGLQKLHETYGDKGVRVIALSVDQKGVEVVRPFIEANGYTFPVAMADEAVRRAYGGIPSIPTTVVIRPDGTVFEVLVGAHPYEDYEKVALAARGGDTATEQ